MAYGPLKPEATTLRYITLDELKERRNLVGTSQWDDALLRAGLSAEWGIDSYNGRSFPDVAPDPVITEIPEAIRQAAYQAALGIFAMGDSPLGVAGSEEFIGAQTQTVGDVVRRAVATMAPGFRVAFPYGGSS